MNGYKLVSALIQAHMPDAAGELAALLAQREEEVPRLRALEHELAFLRRNVFLEGVDVVAASIESGGGPTADGEPMMWRRSGEAVLGDYGDLVVVQGSPRLKLILRGELPSLDAFREGRTP